MGISVTPMMDFFIRRSFRSAGLRPLSVPIDADTTIHCWVSTSLIDPKKPPLLLIHGFGPAATWQWRRQVGPLARRFALVVPDLVCFGGSTTRSPGRSVAFQADCLARLLDRLGVRAGVGVVGTSYGGFVAYHVARTAAPGVVGRVVVASSNLAMGEADERALSERAGVGEASDLMLPKTTEGLRSLLRLCVHRPPRFLPDFVLRDILQNLFNENMDQKMEVFKACKVGTKDGFTPLSQEVLIVWGEHDGIFPLEKAHEIKSLLGEKARLEILKDTSHLPQLEDPDQFNEVITKFLLGEPRSAMGAIS